MMKEMGGKLEINSCDHNMGGSTRYRINGPLVFQLMFEFKVNYCPVCYVPSKGNNFIFCK